jgi:ABC-type nitrate/sulfonate/bicarbonate transport system permease component
MATTFAERATNSMWSLGSLLVGGLIWELGARAVDVSVFPTLTAVIARFFELMSDAQTRSFLVDSLTNLAIGFTISVILGLTVGIAMGVSKTIDTALSVYVKGLLTAPGLAFAPIFFSVLGLSRWTIIGVIVFYGTFIIMLNTASAIREAPANLVEMAKSFCGSRSFIIRRVVIPSAIPLIMAGIRLGAGRAVRGMINGEMFIAVVGLGGAIIDAGRNLDLTTVLAFVGLTILVAFAVLWLVELADRKLTPWVVSNVRS